MINIKEVRTRFAPSPTGHLHIGSARVALFNFLYTKHFNGKFILRIEDTDIVRSDENFSKSIIEDLHWLGLLQDEGPYFQSKRQDIYKSYAEKLLSSNHAYYDNNSSAIYFKVIKEGFTEFKDDIRGRIKFENRNFDDFVIIKSNGVPTYNFACVVDDIEMKITHIIRGDDHISNTPKQILIYNALDREPPSFSHLPMIVGKDNKRLSKRQGAVSVSEYRKQGYLKESLINFLARQSFSYDDKQEIFSLDELIEKFDIKKISKNPCLFDIDKLDWLNGYYIRKLKLTELKELIIPYLKEAGYIKDEYDDTKIEKIAKIFQNRIKKLSDIITLTDYFFKDKIDYDEQSKKIFDDIELLNKIKSAFKILSELQEFDAVNIENSLRKFIEENSLDNKLFFQAIRTILTGKNASPSLFDVIEILGKERIINVFCRDIRSKTNT